MNKTLTVIIVLLALAAVAYALFWRVPDPVSQQPTPVQPSGSPTVVSGASLASDRTAILIDGEAALRIDDPAIIAYFRDPKTSLCDSANIETTPTRRAFCTDDDAFAESARFKEVVSSPATSAVGFVVETGELPDTAVGIFFPKNTTYRTHLLTTYYLGNDFISFSPSGTRFVYRERCFEAACGFTIKETNSLKTVRLFGDPEREPDYDFVRWVSDRDIEYTVGTETRRAGI